jgi:Fe-Mn family superoxide dismutase
MQKRIQDLRQIIIEADTVREKLILEKLPYEKNDLSPVLSEESLNFHYEKLARGYVDRYNRGEGNDDFNKAGAFLHNIFFPQLKKVSGSNPPTGISQEFINKHFENFDTLKSEIEKTAMAIEGSGWVYMSRNGKIKTITNHQIRTDIILLIDWWEHAFQRDYGSDKHKYLKNIWRIIDWKVINDRLGLK